ncbi:MAG TPA: hypothetical protein VGL61_20175 [Kofleriaceae bacterium]|jgi:hypothetical protein
MSLRFATIAAVALACPAAHADPKLVMDGHDQGHMIYADRCSNGGNADKPGRARFVAALRKDPKSKLAVTIAEAEHKFVTDPTLHEITLGDWIQTYHLRDGCADNFNSFSAFVYVSSKFGNSNELWTKYVVTIDDDVTSDRRTLSVRSAVPLDVRDQ